MAFTHGEGVVSAGLERDIALQKASNSDSNQRETLLSVVQMSERVAALKSKIGTLPERTTTQIRSSDNPLLLEKMKSTLLDLQLKRTNLLAKFQPSYRTVQEVDEQIAKTKMPDLTAGDLDAAVRTIAGSARSMGIEVEGVK